MTRDEIVRLSEHTITIEEHARKCEQDPRAWANDMLLGASSMGHEIDWDVDVGIGPVVNGSPLDPGNPSRGYEMNREHTCASGVVWPKGTRYQPSSMGNDGQTVIIAGDPIVFPHYRNR